MTTETPTLPVRANTTGNLLLDPSWDDEVIQQRVVTFYHQRLKQHERAQMFLKRRGLYDARLIDAFQLGFADRSLSRALPDAQRSAGKLIRSRLQRLGLYRSSGHGHHNGCLVVPVWGEHGELLELYGRKIATGTHRQGNGCHLVLSRAKRAEHPNRGVWNVAALSAAEEVILCDSVLNALTVWVAGLPNVTCSWGLDGFTKEHLQALERCSIRRVLIAYRRTDEGDNAADGLAAQLSALGIESYRVLFPAGLDANAHAMRCDSPAEDIGWAHRLANEALGQTLESLMPQTRQLLALMDDYVQQRAAEGDRPRSEVRVKQRELREAFGWSDFQLRKHLARLVELEYVLVYRTGRGNERQYELICQGEGRDGRPFVLGLADISKLNQPRYDGVIHGTTNEPSGI